MSAAAPRHWIEGRGALGREDPPEAIRDIIRVWGVLVDYKPKRRRSWSRALVRHGANGPAALAAVLGVPAEDIPVRHP
jgi:hypothetical protein